MSLRHATTPRIATIGPVAVSRTIAAGLLILWAGSAALTTATAVAGTSSRSLTGPAAAFAIASFTAAATATILARGATSWTGTRVVSWALLSVPACLIAEMLGADIRGVGVGPDGYAIATIVLLAVGLAAVTVELKDHARDDRREVGSDILLVAVVSGGWVYLLLSGGHGAHGSVGHAAITAALGSVAVLLFSARAVVTLWWPSRVHVVQFAASGVLAWSGLAVAFSRQFGAGDVSPVAQALMLLGLAGLAGVLAAEPRMAERAAARAAARSPERAAAATMRARAIRSLLLVVTLVGACVFLGVALIARGDARTEGERALLVGVVAGLVGLRTIGNQRAMAVAHRRAQAALRDRERAVESMRQAIAGLQESDQRVRGLLETAVDGVVEIGPRDVVLRANDAFRSMLALRSEELVGRSWQEVAAMANAESALAALRTTGHAVIEADGRAVHLEARMSQVPTDPPASLLLVRDVTASKVAEQTIRTLFQFLQDRDEDRTRYLRRTNLAIEAERNKIARDLHDGPIQGVAAASLSIEAVRMMIGAGLHDRAGEMLGSIRDELREETENLRRLMSDLRPPLLEERGLVPAVRELASRFQDATGIEVQVRSTGAETPPSEVETIAYRVVQEALSNVKKHAAARTVMVRIETVKGSLEVEVGDDGVGFDASATREYLRRGKVGLASMRERTELGSGTFTLRSRPGGGTTVTASIPFDLLASRN